MAARRSRPFQETREQLIIEGETVKIVTTTTSRVVKLSDFLTNVGTQAGMATPILPSGCKLYYKKGNAGMVVVEKPPQLRTIKWIGMDRDPAKVNWRLAFPYTIFTFTLTGTTIIAIRVNYTQKSLSDPKDELFHSNLANVDSRDIVCTGNVRATGETLTEKLESFIANFWQSEFNQDHIHYNFSPDAGRIKQVASLAAWHKASEEDSLFPLTVEWRKAYTLEKSIEDMKAYM